MKKTNMDLFDAELVGDRIDRLEKKLIIIENPRMDKQKEFPIRGNTSLSIIVLAGTMECVIDMTWHRINVPGMLIVLPTQIVERIAFSDDFKGFGLLMSDSFLADLPMGNKVPLLSNVRQQGYYPLNGQALESIKNYLKMVQEALRSPNKYQYEIVSHLTIAYYYGLGTYIHHTEEKNTTTSRYDQISNDFLELVRTNCHIHRDMNFYADSLCLSSKHINFAVKKVTGDNAMKWIERYTVLHAKNLLTTTTISINELSEKFNFSTPSDFGKYFKKFTGYSPLTFRKMISHL